MATPGRKLGGGRMFRSGEGLPLPPPPTAPRASNPLTPSESSFSLGSPSLSPPASGSLPDLGPDIGSSISVGASGNDGGSQGDRLLCPICNEEMVTLLQLNRHLDDTHQELPEEEQDEVKTWFDKQVLKAKRFQPLSLLNQKLRGLDVFEANESRPIPTATNAMGRANYDGPVDPDELITKNHWQRTTSHDICTDPTCGKGLGPINGSINCRRCGKLFCGEHTMYQIKLSRSANPEPLRGYWARVCETCYKSREGYNDHSGLSVDHTEEFVKMRQKRTERLSLEVARLEKRLTKLTQILVSAKENETLSAPSLLGPVVSLLGQNDTRKMLEQSIVTWEEDEKVAKCPFCHQEFRSWTFRKHHCRICGRVVCADPQTGCSSEVPLKMDKAPRQSGEKNGVRAAAGDELNLDVRLCKECNRIIFSGRDFAASVQHKPPDQKIYETLCQFERGIFHMQPLFHKALAALQQPKLPNGEIDLSKPPPTHAQIQEASKIRKRLVDSFGKYGVAAKRLRNLPTSSPTQMKLQEAVYRYASGFLHLNMLPLQSLPQILRKRSAHTSTLRPRAAQNHTSTSLRHTELAASDTASQTPSETSTAVSQLAMEEKEVKGRLAVLEEQCFLVGEMRRAATKARRLEEATVLSRNVAELEAEIQRLRKQAGDVEARWQGVYSERAAS